MCYSWIATIPKTENSKWKISAYKHNRSDLFARNTLGGAGSYPAPDHENSLLKNSPVSEYLPESSIL
jgi:hypothetical protein